MIRLSLTLGFVGIALFICAVVLIIMSPGSFVPYLNAFVAICVSVGGFLNYSARKKAKSIQH